MPASAPLSRLFIALATYLAEREPWAEAAVAFAAAEHLQPGDGSAPIELRLQALVGGVTSAAIVQAVQAAAGLLRWRQNLNYSDAHFLQRYAYCELLGPTGHAAHAALSAGLLYLAPGTDYPPHAHPAEEVYHLLAGRSRWQQGTDAARSLTPGARVHHATGVPHSMRSGRSPLLALYVWRGDLATSARLSTSVGLL